MYNNNKKNKIYTDFNVSTYCQFILCMLYDIKNIM